MEELIPVAIVEYKRIHEVHQHEEVIHKKAPQVYKKKQ